MLLKYSMNYIQYRFMFLIKLKKDFSWTNKLNVLRFIQANVLLILSMVIKLHCVQYKTN